MAENSDDFRDSGKYITGNIGGKLIIATSHYHPAARISTAKIESNWDTIEKMLRDTPQ